MKKRKTYNLSENKKDYKMPRSESKGDHKNYGVLRKIFADPTWKKAIFYRDPMTRFLSGFSDKCKTEPMRCKNVFGSSDISFFEAAERLKHIDPDIKDGHFRSMTRHCGGLDSSLSHYDFVGDLDAKGGSRELVREMLRGFELTEDQFDKVYPNSDMGHETGSAGKVVQFYGGRPETIAAVVDFYFEDYETFKIAPPDFALDALLALRDAKDPRGLHEEKLKKLLMFARETRGYGKEGKHLNTGVNNLSLVDLSKEGSDEKGDSGNSLENLSQEGDHEKGDSGHSLENISAYITSALGKEKVPLLTTSEETFYWVPILLISFLTFALFVLFKRRYSYAIKSKLRKER